MATVSFKDFSEGEPVVDAAKGAASSSSPYPGFTSVLSDAATGFTKGLLGNSIGVARDLQGLGQRVIAGIDPTRNLDDVRKMSGFKSLESDAPSLPSLLQKGGQKILAAVDPTRNYKQIKKDTGFQSLDDGYDPSGTGAGIDNVLEAKNKAELGGKIGEFVFELLYPAGAVAKTEKGGKAIESIKTFFKGAGPDGGGGTGGTFDKIKSAATSMFTRKPAAAETAIEAAPKVTGAALDEIAPKIMEADELTLPGKAKQKAVELFTRLDDKTKTALQRTPAETFRKVLDDGRKALTDDSITTPLENVGKKIEQGLKIITDKVQQASQAKGQVLYKTDLYTKPVGTIVEDAVRKVEEIFSTIKLDPNDRKFIDKFQESLEELFTTPQNRANKKLADVAEPGSGKGFKGTGPKRIPRLGELDSTIDLLQDRLYKARGDLLLPKTSRVLGPLRQVLGDLNKAAKVVGGKDYAFHIDEVARYIRLQNALNKRLGTEGASSGAFIKRLFSPSDANTKKILDILGKETGEDYFRDARLAKFIMDSLGDPRAKSLLEARDVPLTPTSAVVKATSKLVDYAIKKTGISDPIKAAEAYIKKYGGQKPRNAEALIKLTGGREPKPTPVMKPTPAPAAARSKMTRDMTQLNKMLEREEKSMRQLKSKPKAHAKAYPGRDETYYQNRIDRIKKQMKNVQENDAPF